MKAEERMAFESVGVPKPKIWGQLSYHLFPLNGVKTPASAQMVASFQTECTKRPIC